MMFVSVRLQVHGRQTEADNAAFAWIRPARSLTKTSGLASILPVQMAHLIHHADMRSAEVSFKYGGMMHGL